MFDDLVPFLCVMVYVLVFMSSHYIWTDMKYAFKFCTSIETLTWHS